MQEIQDNTTGRYTNSEEEREYNPDFASTYDYFNDVSKVVSQLLITKAANSLTAPEVVVSPSGQAVVTTTTPLQIPNIFNINGESNAPKSKNKPKANGEPNSVEIQRDANGNITKYTEFGPNGEFVKEVRITGKTMEIFLDQM